MRPVSTVNCTVSETPRHDPSYSIYQFDTIIIPCHQACLVHKSFYVSPAGLSVHVMEPTMSVRGSAGQANVLCYLAKYSNPPIPLLVLGDPHFALVDSAITGDTSTLVAEVCLCFCYTLFLSLALYLYSPSTPATVSFSLFVLSHSPVIGNLLS